METSHPNPPTLKGSQNASWACNKHVAPPFKSGADGSFVTAGGSTFDFGMHVLDYDRSPVATRLFSKVMGGAVHKTQLHRGIALAGHVMPYAPHPTEMPDELRRLWNAGRHGGSVDEVALVRDVVARRAGARVGAERLREVMSLERVLGVLGVTLAAGDERMSADQVQVLVVLGVDVIVERLYIRDQLDLPCACCCATNTS